MKRCNQCGQQLSDETAFCSNCGGSNFEPIANAGDYTYQQPGQQPYYQQPYYQSGQQPNYQQPYQQPTGGAYQPASPAKGKAIASLVLGIVALLLCWWGWVGIISIVLSIIGIILGIGSRKELPAEQGRGMATAGMICSIIALVLSSIVLVACVICTSTLYGLGTWYGY